MISSRSAIGRRATAWSIVHIVATAAAVVVLGAMSQRAATPVLAAAPGQTTSNTVPATVSSGRALLNSYCVSCHNERLKIAGLLLDHIDVSDVGQQADVWEKVAKKLRAGDMPPAGRPRPDGETTRTFVSWLEAGLDRKAAAHPEPGTPTIHRLNRTEYANAVRDLIGIEIDARSLLPADDADKHGFDNIADVLSLSPALLERYLSAARKITRLALGTAPAAPATIVYQVPKSVEQDSRLSNDLPLGSRGGLAVHHDFPADGEFRIKIRLQRNLYDLVRGLGAANSLEVRVDGVRVKLFTVGGEEHGQTAPLAHGGTIDGSPEWEKYARTADANLEVQFSARAGRRVVTAAFLADRWMDDEVLQPRQVGFGRDTNEMFDRPAALESLTVSGPYGVSGRGETASRRRILVCQPARAADEDQCAREIVSRLARRAYRRPVTTDDVETLLRLYRARRGEVFEARIELALRALLTSPEFLFRIERDPVGAVPGQPYRISDLELASRLSFFLWSSIPDEELLDAAIRGRLKAPAVLERQVRRMLADERARALVDNFAGQWLVVRNVRDVTPDPDIFPEFDDNLRQAFQQETELFVASQLAGDRSVAELLSANYTFLNERLARHYGVPNVYGERFRRVVFTDRDNRGGLLGQGSVLTVTSYPNRTSPVLRGKWLMENILGTPPPEPPPNVPALKENGSGQVAQTVRARLEAHRRNVVCATCHAPMDPLGFALENFDAIGGFRTSDAGAPIDSRGALPNGLTFQGFAGLRQVLATSYREQFVRTVVEKLLTYALGRAVEPHDLPTVRLITREAAAKDYRWSTMIVSLVRSVPFQMRVPQELTRTANN